MVLFYLIETDSLLVLQTFMIIVHKVILFFYYLFSQSDLTLGLPVLESIHGEGYLHGEERRDTLIF